MPLPTRFEGLPIDERGFPVPWFVAFVDGKPDFRVIGEGKIAQAVRGGKCWLCGQPLGIHLVFVIGPMCAVNRVISEPPSHSDCAEFAAKACPFLTKPGARRNEKNIPAGSLPAAGLGIDRNPGVTCLWTTRSYKIFKPRQGQPGNLFDLGEPERISWWAQGRAATRAEVIASIDSGLPILREQAIAEGPHAVDALKWQIDRVQPLLPAA